MRRATRWLSVVRIPTAIDPRLAAGAGGVLDAVTTGFQVLVRALVAMPLGSVGVTLLFLIEPDGKAGVLPEARMYFGFSGDSDVALGQIAGMVEKGGLSSLYAFEEAAAPESWNAGFLHACDVVRRTVLLKTALDPEENYELPPRIFEAQSFAANDRNGYGALETLLTRTLERLAICISVEPGNGDDLVAMLGYEMERLSAANQSAGGMGSFARRHMPGWGAEPASEGVEQLEIAKRRSSLVEGLIRQNHRVGELLRGGCVRFRCTALGMSPAQVRGAASVLAAEAFRDGHYDLVMNSAANAEGGAACLPGTSPPLIQTPFVEHIASHYPASKGLEWLGQSAAPEELGGLFRLPVSGSEAPHLWRDSLAPPAQDASDMIVLGRDEWPDMPGVLGEERGLRISDAPKGFVFTGMPGSGKSVALANIFFQLYQAGIPALYIAPITSEELCIKLAMGNNDPETCAFGKAVRVYTPGQDGISPFALNPMHRYPWISIPTKAEMVVECCWAAIPYFPALESPLRDAVAELLRRAARSGEAPRFADLPPLVREAVEGMGYAGEVLANIGAASENRLRNLSAGSMAGLLETGLNDPDMGALTSEWSVLSLGAYSEREKALFMMFVLSHLQQYLSGQPHHEGAVRMALIIDEAHLIAGRAGGAKAGEEAADPQAFTTRAVQRMLAEYRKLGVATFWADQSPAKIDPDLIRMTGSKCVGRITHARDRQEIGSAISFGEREQDHLILLGPGQAYFHAPGYPRPQLLRLTPLHQRMPLDRVLTPLELGAAMEGEEWLEESRNRIGLERLIGLAERQVRFQEGLQKTQRFAKTLREELGTADNAERGKLREVAQKRLGRLEREFDAFHQGDYLRIVEVTACVTILEVQETRAALMKTFEAEVAPAVERLRNELDELSA